MDVSIIIVTYNTASITKQCIESVFDKTKDISFEVILIDNNSIDNTVDLFSNDSRIVFIENLQNLGFGQANNIGIKQAKGKYVLLLNSDTILLNNAVKIFYDNMESKPDTVCCIGTCLLDLNGNITYSYGRFIYLSDLFHKFNNECNVTDSEFEVSVVLGADMFIRRKVLDEVGTFDPMFFMYHEENDLQRRFVNYGYKNMIISGPKIIHLEGKSTTKNVNLLKIKSTFIYIKKWNSPVYYFLYRIVYFITRILKVFTIEGNKNRILYVEVLIKGV